MKCKLSVLVFLALFSQFALAAHYIYGLENTERVASPSNGPFYIQTATFKSSANAIRMRDRLAARYHLPVFIKTRGALHSVVIGPVNSLGELNPVQGDLPKASLSVVSKTRIIAPLKEEPVAVAAIPFLQIDGGFSFPVQKGNMSVHNGSSFPAPYDVDVFTTDFENSAMLGVWAGYQWREDRTWLPAWSLALRYQHFFLPDLQGRIIQYSLPAFTNYNYQLDLESNALTIATKIGLGRFYHLMPYASAGIGMAFNQSTDYQETPIPSSGVTPRFSPAFKSQINTEFTWSLGAGLDYLITPGLHMSLGYEFQDLGPVESGSGVSTWSSEKLSLGHYQTQSVLLSLSYLFGN